jgi:spoIIIJ-associated protein
MSSDTGFETRVTSFVGDVVEAMGLDLEVGLETAPDHLRVNLEGDDGELLLRRKGEALDALQHIVNSAFRHEVGDERRLVVDCLGFRRAKDRELRQMARYMIDRARETGLPQEMGPLNSYARRLVHLEVASESDVASTSIGDGALKRVVIALKPADARGAAQDS